MFLTDGFLQDDWDYWADTTDSEPEEEKKPETGFLRRALMGRIKKGDAPRKPFVHPPKAAPAPEAGTSGPEAGPSVPEAGSSAPLAAPEGDLGISLSGPFIRPAVVPEAGPSLLLPGAVPGDPADVPEKTPAPQTGLYPLPITRNPQPQPCYHTPYTLKRLHPNNPTPYTRRPRGGLVRL